MQPLPPPLPAAQLALRNTLPLKPAPVILEGRFVRMEPLDVARDAAPLFALSSGAAISTPGLEHPAYDAEALIWRYLFDGPFATVEEMAAAQSRQVAAADMLPFTVFERETGHAVGTLSLMRNQPQHLSIELGSIWYTPPVQRTPVNTEATYLALRHCFGLGYRRLEWKCNALNERSRRAALRMSFTFEAIQEAHMIVKGSSRDTAWFRILHDEWPSVQRHLETMLYGRC
jgi:RimJ/RimL family protein N-acetyltransferase